MQKKSRSAEYAEFDLKGTGVAIHCGYAGAVNHLMLEVPSKEDWCQHSQNIQDPIERGQKPSFTFLFYMGHINQIIAKLMEVKHPG